MTRLILQMNNDVWEALLEWSRREYRDPRAQAALIIRDALQKAGLLKPETETSEKEKHNNG